MLPYYNAHYFITPIIFMLSTTETIGKKLILIYISLLQHYFICFSTLYESVILYISGATLCEINLK